MEISTEIKRNIRWHVVQGVIDIGTLSDYLKEIYTSPDFDSNMSVLWDLHEADFRSVPVEAIFSFRDYVAKHWGKEGKSKAALVVPEIYGHGISRLYKIIMESKSSSPVAVFKDMDEARAWIESD